MRIERQIVFFDRDLRLLKQYKVKIFSARCPKQLEVLLL